MFWYVCHSNCIHVEKLEKMGMLKQKSTETSVSRNVGTKGDVSMQQLM